MSDEFEDCVLIANWTNVDPSEYHYISRHCDNLYAAVAILDLPITSDLIYLVSRGAHGSVKVMFDREIDKAVASVAVDVLYQSPYTLDEAKVCLLQRVKGKNGVGLFVRSFIMICNTSARPSDRVHTDTGNLDTRSSTP